LYYKTIGNIVWAFDQTVFTGNVLTFTASDDFEIEDNTLPFYLYCREVPSGVPSAATTFTMSILWRDEGKNNTKLFLKLN
jgi:hypothetical protein